VSAECTIEMRDGNIGDCAQWHLAEGSWLTGLTDGVFYAELNEFFQRELAEEGYSGVEVRVTPTVTDIIIRATHTQEVLGEQGRRIRELTSLIQKRFKFPENSVSLYAAKVQNRGLSAVAQCESLRYKLLNGLAVRRACYGVLRFIMESGAKGCEVVVSGKLRAARAKSMKFTVRIRAPTTKRRLQWLT
jgi:ribosomal protein uS3